MSIKVLGICASPRRGGNSEFLLGKALGTAKSTAPDLVETELFSIVGKKFAGCISCFRCIELKGDCTIKDDFQELMQKWDEADVILYSIPVYHMSIPGQLRCFIDRLGNATVCKYNLQMPKQLKVVGTITQGAHLFSGQENVIIQVMNHALMMGCLPVAGDSPECYTGAASWTSNDIAPNALKQQIDSENFDATIGLKAVNSLAKRAVELAVIIKSGADVSRKLLGKEQTYGALLKRIDTTK